MESKDTKERKSLEIITTNHSKSKSHILIKDLQKSPVVIDMTDGQTGGPYLDLNKVNDHLGNTDYNTLPV